MKICTGHYRITSFLKFIILLDPCHETSYSLDEILGDNYMHRRNFGRYFLSIFHFLFGIFKSLLFFCNENDIFVANIFLFVQLIANFRY